MSRGSTPPHGFEAFGAPGPGPIWAAAMPCLSDGPGRGPGGVAGGGSLPRDPAGQPRSSGSADCLASIQSATESTDHSTLASTSAFRVDPGCRQMFSMRPPEGGACTPEKAGLFTAKTDNNTEHSPTSRIDSERCVVGSQLASFPSVGIQTRLLPLLYIAAR
jgi:hypothetical protein